MTPETISAAIDKIAEKLGVAADSLEPLLEKTIEQYVIRAWFMGIADLIMSAGAVIIACFCLRGLLRGLREESAERSVISGAALILSALFFLILFSCATEEVGHAIAPLPSMLNL